MRVRLLRTDDEVMAAVGLVGRYWSWRLEVEGAAGRARPSRAAAESAAAQVAAWQRRVGDPFVLACIVEDCRAMARGRVPLPTAYAELLGDLALGVRVGAKRRRGNQGKSLADRELWRTHAHMVEVCRPQCANLDEACERVAEFPAVVGKPTGPTVKKHWNWAVRDAAVKGGKSE